MAYYSSLLRSEKSSTDGYLELLMGYARSQFRDFETNLRIFVGLDEKKFSTNHGISKVLFDDLKKQPGIHSVRDISETNYNMGDHEGILQIKYDDVSMKTKLILTRFGLTFGTSIFD